MIAWGELLDQEEALPADASELSMELELDQKLLPYAHAFMANWQLPVPKIYKTQIKGSCYSLKHEVVFLNFDQTDKQALRANKNLVPMENAEELAALFCLCHELTHAVQHHFLGDAMLANRLGAEAQADTVAGYWLSPQLKNGVADLVSNIAFQLKHNPATMTHPYGCTRQSCVKKGMSIGSAMLLQDGDLFASVSSRQQLFKESQATAEGCLKHDPRPCDLLGQNSPNFMPQLCTTCPKA